MHVSDSDTVQQYLTDRTSLPRQRQDPAPQFTSDVAVVGLGYVGLPTLTALHAAGLSVVGLEVSRDRIEAIRGGAADLLDRDQERLAAALADERVVLTTDESMLATAANVIVCVPTPVDSHQTPDLAILAAACAAVVRHAREGQLLVLTSTTYVGTTEDLLVQPLAERGLVAGLDLNVAFSPERINPGSSLKAHEEVPRVVGGHTIKCAERCADLLGKVVQEVFVVSSTAAAEMCKLLENTFRAVNIAMINEFAEASRVLGVDVMEVIAAASTKPYGYMPFTPGAGVGGHCIPCDPHYLTWQLRRSRHSMPVVEQAMRAISARPGQVTDRARQLLSDIGKPLRGAKVLIVGLAYKPDVQDLRESPALLIAEDLVAAGAEVGYHEPFAPTVTLRTGMVLTHQPDAATADFDLVVLHTRHRGLDPAIIHGAPLVLDTTYAEPHQPHIHQL